jgi:hypothetical protein
LIIRSLPLDVPFRIVLRASSGFFDRRHAAALRSKTTYDNFTPIPVRLSTLQMKLLFANLL